MDSTLAKGLAVLDWLVRQQRDCRVTDVAAAFGIQRSNAHRTLQTLVASGWALQDPATSAYRPSLRLFELGALVEATSDLKALLRPALSALAQATGETIHLAVLDGAEIVYLDKFDSPLPVAAYSRIGGRAPAHCVASGKALLGAAGLDAAALAGRLGALAAHTPNSITDPVRLAAELSAARQNGFAVNREEWRQGVCGLGSAVRNARGEPVAAIGISVPAMRFGKAQAQALAQALQAAALQAEQILGYRPEAATERSARPLTTPRRHA